ncbi:MAG: hypothetical protein IJX84_09010 [Clostridia bacterium]|nr:hypothetical protein [Clostridia bacterium]
MKRSVLCIFSLVLYLLLACTMLSAKIEEEMMPQVEAKTLKYKGTTLSFSPDVLFHDEQGDHFYHAANGSGWESGLRIREFMPAQYYYDIFEQIAFTGTPQTYHFIMSASRQPVEGEKVHIVEEFEAVEDVHLYCYSGALPEDLWMPQHTSIIGQSSHALLVRNTRAQLPFFQHTAKTLSIAASQADHAYSLTEISSFIQSLPPVTLIWICLLAGFLLLLLFWTHRSASPGKLTYIIAAAFFLISAAILLSRIDLPASLLPTENIFDLAHYISTFGLILHALEQCGENFAALALQHSIHQCLLVGVGGLLLGVTFIMLTRRFLCRR